MAFLVTCLISEGDDVWRNLRGHELYGTDVDEESFFRWSGDMGFFIVNCDFGIINESIRVVIVVLDLSVSWNWVVGHVQLTFFFFAGFLLGLSYISSYLFAICSAVIPSSFN
jgi:hypothetical protein